MRCHILCQTLTYTHFKNCTSHSGNIHILYIFILTSSHKTYIDPGQVKRTSQIYCHNSITSRQTPTFLRKRLLFPCLVLLDEWVLSILIVNLSMKVEKSLLNSKEADGVWQFCSWFCLRRQQTESSSVEVRALPLIIRVKPRKRVTFWTYSGQALTLLYYSGLFTEVLLAFYSANVDRVWN